MLFRDLREDMPPEGVPRARRIVQNGANLQEYIYGLVQPKTRSYHPQQSFHRPTARKTTLELK